MRRLVLLKMEFEGMRRRNLSGWDVEGGESLMVGVTVDADKAIAIFTLVRVLRKPRRRNGCHLSKAVPPLSFFFFFLIVWLVASLLSGFFIIIIYFIIHRLT